MIRVVKVTIGIETVGGDTEGPEPLTVAIPVGGPISASDLGSLIADAVTIAAAGDRDSDPLWHLCRMLGRTADYVPPPDVLVMGGPDLITVDPA
jgi:hypothetical protein